jgi:paraquat-inducible protein A
MPTRVDDRDLATWRECRDCGLLQRLPEIPDGEAAVCGRCGATLRRAARDSINFARISGVACASLFVLALGLPFIELRVLGRFSTSTLFTGPSILRERGLPGLALVVLLTLVLMPAVKIGVELTVLFGVRAEHPPRWLPWVFGWLERIAPWSMVEVFLLGSFVAYTRLRELADVSVGPAIFALGGVMLSMVATDGTLDREAIWQDLEAKGTRLDRAAPDDTPGSSAVTRAGAWSTPGRRRPVRAAVMASSSARPAEIWGASGRCSSPRRSSTSPPTSSRS